MVKSLREALDTWNQEEPRAVIFRGGSPDTFCAGGDVVSLYFTRKAMANSPGEPLPPIFDEFFRNELALDYGLATMEPVQVALWNGMV